MMAVSGAEALQSELAYLCGEAQTACADYGLPDLTHVTLLLRDPENDDMYIVVTNDDMDEVARIAALDAASE